MRRQIGFIAVMLVLPAIITVAGAQTPADEASRISAWLDTYDDKVHVLGDGRTAYVTSLYFIKAKMGERTLDSGGLETLVLVKDERGAWKIRHTHTSPRARRPPA